jgi:dienelactone hydrolase
MASLATLSNTQLDLATRSSSIIGGPHGSTFMRVLSLTLAVLVVGLALSACSPVQPPADPAVATPSATLVAPVEYNLGEATIVQQAFAEDSRFRNMPVRLNGVMAAPAAGGPYPVVLILHGTHPGCPEIEHGVDRWPCDPDVEQPNYRGFEYLVRKLAAKGYVALAPNINAENTFGFGEPVPGERLEQLVDLHLRALAEANAGKANQFGMELEGRVDLSRLTIVGHSRGGEAAVALARDLAAQGERGELAYGPVNGLLLIAPAPGFVDPAQGVPAPMAILLPACDADVVEQIGQVFFEALRLQETHEWATSVWLARANHNAFNEILPADPFGLQGRPDCASLLEDDVQRSFTAEYAIDFLTTVYSLDPTQIRQAMTRMGMDVHAPAVDQIYGQTAQVMLLAASHHRLPLLTPTSAAEFTDSPFGGEIVVEGLTTQFCPEGFYTPFTAPELEACRRAHVVVPGQPAHAIISWEAPGGSLRFELPPGLDNLTLFDALSVRVAVEPLSPLNIAGVPQAFSVRLRDRQGNHVEVPVRTDEPALRFPVGELGDEFLDTPLFTGRVPLFPVRMPLSEFAGVNLASIAEVAIVFDQTDRGTLFLADVELVRSPIAGRTTLDDPPSAELVEAAEAGDVEAQRQLANLYRPTEVMGVQYGNLEAAVNWYRKSCENGYANGQVDFFLFARTHAERGDDSYLGEALVCLEDAVRQGHRSAIVQRGFHAAYVEQDYLQAYFLHALLDEVDPDWAAQRFAFADQLTAAEVETAEANASAWRAENKVNDYEDFFAEVNSPFRQPASQP